jgi:hypothetical protein
MSERPPCVDCGGETTTKDGVRCATCRVRQYRKDPEKRERDRERSRRWKREHLGQPGRPSVTSDPCCKTPGNQSDPATVGAVRGHGNQERGS